MSALARRTLTSTVGFQTFLALLIFLSAGTMRYWQGWVYWTTFSLTSAVTAAYFLQRDPELARRRLKIGPTAERRPIQRRIQTVTSLAICAVYVIAGLDRRYGWSSMPAALAWVGNVIVVASYLAIIPVFRANSYAAGTVKVERDQPVISTGPYAIVRHPLYATAAVTFLASPFALGSYWALPAAVLVVLAMMVRLIDEEKLLAGWLPEYDDYRRKVRWRMIPFVW